MPHTIDKHTLQKYDVAGPRYTSYPTAPEWSPAVNASIYTAKLQAVGEGFKTLSVYIHLPFCEQLCYFCACNKVIRPKEEKVGNEYLDFLFKEIDLVVKQIGRRKQVKQLHWGGGTPTYLNEVQSSRLFEKLAQAFDIDKNGEIAIEIDPRTVTFEKLKHLRGLGFNRVSMGVQDFDPKVQDDINRIQPFEQVKQVNDWCRQLGFSSVNFDLIYGLPYQTRVTFGKTVDQVISLRPDRIALYSFAYVPWLSKPQNKFNLDAVPVHDEKLDIFIQSRDKLVAGGYLAIAMDHFALKTDDMAKAFEEGKLHRNFMGYTLKPADEFLGLGVSAIGYLENTYVQNVKVLPDYYERLNKGELPIERGKELSDDDRMRQWVINSLMCSFKIDKQAFFEEFDVDFGDYFADEALHLTQCAEDGLISQNRESIIVTDLGRIFIRNVCMGFDSYLRKKDGHKRFSRTV
jgi:oxygen-independent coproporphyrinogen III oxidase